MEDVGGQFDSMPEANLTTEAAANDVVQSEKASDSLQSQVGCSGGGQFVLETKATSSRQSYLQPGRCQQPAIQRYCRFYRKDSYHEEGMYSQ
jgi:hypothetical protein